MGHHRLQRTEDIEENDALLDGSSGEARDIAKHRQGNSFVFFDTKYFWSLCAVMFIFLLSFFDFMHVLVIKCSMLRYASLRAELHELPFRSTFVGFDDFYARKNVSTDLVTNIPRVLLQLDSSQPSAVSPLWTEKWITDGGMVPFNERRTIVTPSISTFAEFHVMDYGMEKCIVSLALPTLPSSSTASANDMRLDIWKLEFDHRLDPDSLTWSKRPAREQRLGSFSIKSNSTQALEGYRCKSGTYQVLEISCGSGPCDIDVAASGQEARGIFITQRVFD